MKTDVKEKKSVKPRIYTHIRVDFDAVVSIWFYLRFVLKSSLDDVYIKFVPANWSGDMLDIDIALDIDAGGQGIKGRKNFGSKSRSSCFKRLFDLYYENIASEEIDYLRSFAKFLDKHDTGGIDSWRNIDVSKEENNRFSKIGLAGLIKVLHGLHSDPSNSDYDICVAMISLLDNDLRISTVKDFSSESLKTTEWLSKVAISKDAKYNLNDYLFKQGFKLVVFIKGNTLGIVSKKGDFIKADNEYARRIIYSTGEQVANKEGAWFAHEDGSLLVWGGVKAPAKYPSRVDVNDLAKELNKYLQEQYSKKGVMI